jgi:hypothetical protein
MSGHSDSHEAFLERVVAGDLPSSDAEVRARLAECPECRDVLAQMQSVMGKLTRAGELEQGALRDVLAEQPRPPSAEFEQHVRAHVHAQLGRRPRPSAARRVAQTLAIAAGLVMVALLYRVLVPARPEEVLLGRDQIACERPVGAGADFGTFSWHFDLPKRGRFELRVWDDSSPEATQPLVEEVDLTESRWTREPDDQRQWPERIRWEVRAYDAADQLLRRSELQRASRSP